MSGLIRRGPAARWRLALRALGVPGDPAAASHTADPRSAPPAGGGAPLDLAALAPSPTDPGREGVGLYAPEASALPSLPFAATLWGPGTMAYEPPAGFTDRLWAAGWRRAYQGALALPVEPTRPGEAPPEPAAPALFGPPPAVVLTARIAEYADARGAADGIDLEWQAYEAPLPGPVPLDPPRELPLARVIGDGARLTVATYTALAEGDARFPVLALGFRLDRLTVFVSLADRTGGQLRVATAEGTADDLAIRLQAALGGVAAGPGLAALVGRVSGEPVAPTEGAGYLVRDGHVLRLAGDTADRYRERAAGFRGAAAAFGTTQAIAGGSRAEMVSVSTTLLAFGDAPAATAWFAGQLHQARGPTTAEATAGGFAISRPVETAPSRAIGDGTAALTFDLTFAAPLVRVTSRAALVAARRGRFGFVVTAQSLAGPPPVAALEALAAAQVACLDAGGCPDPTAVPDGLAPG